MIRFEGPLFLPLFFWKMSFFFIFRLFFLIWFRAEAKQVKQEEDVDEGYGFAHLIGAGLVGLSLPILWSFIKTAKQWFTKQRTKGIRVSLTPESSNSRL